MQGFLPGSARKEPRDCGGDGNAREREHDGHHRQVATHAREQ
jgi:hypothetical protein